MSTKQLQSLAPPDRWATPEGVQPAKVAGVGLWGVAYIAVIAYHDLVGLSLAPSGAQAYNAVRGGLRAGGGGWVGWVGAAGRAVLVPGETAGAFEALPMMTQACMMGGARSALRLPHGTCLTAPRRPPARPSSAL